MKITLFGGSGFIGSRLAARLLRKGHEVTIADVAVSLVHPERSRVCDVRDLEAVQRVCRGADVIYNLAAAHRDDVRPRSLYYDVNVRGAANVCAAADALGISKIIFASSVAIYGFSATELDEDAQPAPFNDYGATKLEAEHVHRAWIEKKPDRSLAIVRPTVVFGEGNRGNVFTLIDQIKRGRFAMVGDGETVKSIAYVENVSAFLEYVLKCNSGLYVYNYVDKPDYKTRDLVRAIRQHLGKRGDALRMPYAFAKLIGAGGDLVSAATGKPFPLSRIRVRKFCSPSRFSSARAMATGFRPPVSLTAGLRRTIAHDLLGEDATPSTSSSEAGRGWT